MKKILTLFFLLALGTACAEVTVTDMVIAEGRDGIEPVNPGTVFTSDVTELWCFTTIHGIEASDDEPPTIAHVWSHKKNGQFVESFRIDLSIGGDKWRTRSQKTVNPGSEGTWRVQILDPSGRVIASQQFEIVPLG